jgi:predicted DNA-binding protein with PD1-like motif
VKYKEVEPGNFLIRLDKGEEVIEQIISFAREKNVRGGIFSGIGGIVNASIGNYSSALGQYITKSYKNMLEVCQFNGNISVQEDNGELQVHAHVTGANEQDGVVVGHLFGATVEVTMEIFLKSFNMTLMRKFDPDTEYRIWHF